MRRRFIALISLAVVAAGIAAGHLGCELSPDDGATAGKGSSETSPDRLALFITGSTSGNLEPCNCPGQPRGGLSRRQTLLVSLASRYGPGALLDAGNMLQLAPDPVADRYMLTGYARLGYDAVAVGDQELDRGGKEFVALAETGNLPLVATNVSVEGVTIAPTHRWVEIVGRRVLVLAVLGPRKLAFSQPHIRRQVKLSDPVEAVGRVLAEVASAGSKAPRPDLVVVLAQLDSTERAEIVPRLGGGSGRGVDLVVLGTEKDRPVRLERFGTVPAVYAPARGRQIAAVVFEGVMPGQSPRIAEVQGHPVEQALGRDKALWEHYQAYTYDAQQRTLKLLGRLGTVRYVPSAHCGKCHVAQFKSWQKHKHGQAWATIVREGRTLDPNCMRCHTTGYGFIGGFRTAKQTPQLADVGCQDCHQVDPTSHELSKPPQQVPKVYPSVCRTCHTDAKGPDFTPGHYLPQATCPKGAAVEPNGH